MVGLRMFFLKARGGREVEEEEIESSRINVGRIKKVRRSGGKVRY